MLKSLTMSEYVDWIAYFSIDWDGFKAQQSPEQIALNLAAALPGRKRKK